MQQFVLVCVTHVFTSTILELLMLADCIGIGFSMKLMLFSLARNGKLLHDQINILSYYKHL